jgi:alpha-tubulin suppressor-like RCC1 family protein
MHAACSAPVERTDSSSSAIVYGVDDRKNPVDFASASLALKWADAVAVLAKKPGNGDESLCVASSNDYCYLNTNFAIKHSMPGTNYPLCANEKFSNETVLKGGACTVFRVSQNASGQEIFVTAGHCLKEDGNTAGYGTRCSDAEFAFGYQVRSFGTRHPKNYIPFALRRKWDVYQCAGIIKRVHQPSSIDQRDFTIFRADRVVRGRRMLDIRRTSSVQVNDPTTHLGHGAAFPLKITPNATVRWLDLPNGVFYFSGDALQGDSGGPVIDVNTKLVTGIIGAGPPGIPDFTHDSTGTCLRYTTCSDTSGCSANPNYTEATDVDHPDIKNNIPSAPSGPSLHADLDADGVPDKITLVQGVGFWAVNLNFTSGQTCPLCPIPTLIPTWVPLADLAGAVHVGDFNGDALHDLVVQFPGYPTIYIEGYQLDLKDPYSAAQSFLYGGNYAAVLAGDFNSDFQDDLRALGASGNHASVFMGVRSGPPGSAPQYPGGLAPAVEIPPECGDGITMPANYSSTFPSLTAYTASRAVAVIPASLVAVSGANRLLVVDCPGTTAQSRLKLIDPLTGLVKKTVTMSGVSNWRAFQYRHTKSDLLGLRSPNDPSGSYEIVKIALTSASTATVTPLATRLQQGIATGIGWNDPGRQITVLVSSGGTSRRDQFNDTLDDQFVYQFNNPLGSAVCLNGVSQPNNFRFGLGGLVMSGSTELLACNRRFLVDASDTGAYTKLIKLGQVSGATDLTYGGQNGGHFHDIECDTDSYLTPVVWGVTHSGRMVRSLPVKPGSCASGGKALTTAEICYDCESGISGAAAGGHSTFVMANDGNVRAAGENAYGQLTLPAGPNVATATPIPAYAGASAIDVSPGHSLALVGGTVLAAGSNSVGQLGRSDVAQTHEPAPVANLPSITSVAAGDAFSLALDVNGNVWAWGANDWGQLGDGTFSSRSRPLRVRGLEDLTGTFATTWGGYGTTSGRFDRPQGVAVDATSVFVSDLSNRIQRFTSDGALLAVFGSTGNGNGQFLGSSGLFAASSRDGSSLYVLDPAAVEIQKFKIVPVSQSCPGGTSEVVASGSRVCFVTRWGQSGTGNGQLGNPAGISVCQGGEVFVADAGNHRIQKFVQVSSGSSCPAGTTEIAAVGAEKTCAAGYFGSLGSGDGQLDAPRAVACDPDTPAVYVADTGNHRLQRFSSAGAHLGKWGAHGAAPGELDQPVDIDVDDAGRVVVTDFGNARVQVFTAGGALLAIFGGPGTGNGQFSAALSAAVLGNRIFVVDELQHRVQAFDVAAQASIVKIAAGGRHALALRSDGRVWSWGANERGQLGADRTDPTSSVPVRVRDSGTSSGMLFAADVSAGSQHSLAAHVDGSARAWGANGSGQLGDGTMIDRRVATEVRGASNVAAVQAGDGHSLALTKLGRVLAWGGNASGQLGDGTYTDRLEAVEIGEACDLTGTLRFATAIAAGADHSLAVGCLLGWGKNTQGQLADGGASSSYGAPHRLAFSPGPDCGGAVASPAELETSGALEEIEIVGLTSGDGSPLELTIRGVFQDEPQLSPSDQSAPDAVIGELPVRVRAERSSDEDGRVYHVAFTAREASGRTCNGTVSVCVPVSGGQCTDGGALFQSTAPEPDVCAMDPEIGQCDSCLRSQCCGELTRCAEPDACAIGGPNRGGELACVIQCLEEAFYQDESLVDARERCESTCSDPSPGLSEATVALLNCMVGPSSGCAVSCLGTRYE